MRNVESVIAKIVLIGYLLVLVMPALPVEVLSIATSKTEKKVCKSNAIIAPKHIEVGSEKKSLHMEERVPDISQTGLFLLCNSSPTYLPPVFANELWVGMQQENNFAMFIPSLYALLFQNLDTDPPKGSFC